MKFVSLKFSTKKILKFFLTLMIIFININITFSNKQKKNESEKLKEKFNPIPVEKKTPYEKILKNMEFQFLKTEKNEKFSVANRDIKVKKNLKKNL